MRRVVFAAIAVTLLPFAIATADRRRPPRKPPQAAFDACAKAARGAACSISFGDHRVAGTCEPFPETTALACRPERRPGPPPEAVEACASAKEGDACTMTHGDRTISGTCAAPPHGQGALACRPAAPPPR